MRITTQEATFTDISAITTIIKKNIISIENSTHKQESTGFLLFQYTNQDIQSFIADKENYFVQIAKMENNIVGYAIACNLKEMPALHLSLQALSIFNNQFEYFKILYLKQIAKKPGTHGVGKALMQSLFTHAAKKKYDYIVSRVVHEPIKNRISVSLHEKFGFNFVSLMQEKDHMAGLYLKQL